MIETSTRREIFIASTSFGGSRFRTASPNNRDTPAMHPRIHAGSRWRLLLRPTAHRFASRAYRGTPNLWAVQVRLGHALDLHDRAVHRRASVARPRMAPESTPTVHIGGV